MDFLWDILKGGRSAFPAEMRFAWSFLIVFLALSVLAQPLFWEAHASEIRVSAGSSIQQAIDSASPGDTVLVSPGTYSEQLVINKPLHLIGESKDSTTVDGAGSSPIVLVGAGEVEIRGFTIRNAGGFYGQGILLSGVRGVNITDNIISASVEGDGVTLFNSNQNRITDNVFLNNLYAVNATNSNFNVVARNVATSNTVGVQLWNSESNIVANNSMKLGESGVDMILARQNKVVSNSMSENTLTGIFLERSDQNQVIENSIQQNRIGINVQNSQNNEFHNNNLVSNSQFQVNHPNPADIPLNRWDNGTAGNYWSDYLGQDNDGDGVGDTLLPHAGVDNHPLMSPFIPVALAAQALASPVSGEAPLLVRFDSKILGGKAPHSYFWDLGDGTTASLASVVHTYHSEGSYIVRLRVTDAVESLDEDSITVTVSSSMVRRSSSLPYVVGGAGVFMVLGLGVFWFVRRRGRSKGIGRRALGRRGG